MVIYMGETLKNVVREKDVELILPAWINSIISKGGTKNSVNRRASDL
jgi:hypothetical protein